MCKNKLVVWILTAEVLVLLVGCSQSKRHEAGQNLLDEVNRAEKLYSRALSLLANPVYQIDREYPPLRSKVPGDESEIVIFSGGEIHPEVLPILKNIEDSLSAALSAGEDAAGPAEKAVARTMLARVSSLRGYCHGLAVCQADIRLADLRARCEGILATVSRGLDLLEHYSAVVSMSDREIRNLRAQGVAAQAMVETEIAEIDRRVAAIEEERSVQSREYERQNAEARSMSIEARIGPAKEGLEKLEKALEIQAQANSAEARVAEMEHEANSLAKKRQALELDLQAAEGEVSAAEEELARGEALKSESITAAQEMRREIQEALEQLQELLIQMEYSSGQLADALVEAGKAYDSALSHLGGAGTGAISGVPAREAGVLMTAADMQVRVLAGLESNRHLVGDMATIWSRMGAGPLPAAAMKIQSFLSDPGSLRSDAEAKYSKAIELYESALRGVDRRHRWAYQGELAGGYVRLYELTENPETLVAARETLNEALEGKEFSPNLISIAELRDILAASEQQGPAAGVEP